MSHLARIIHSRSLRACQRTKTSQRSPDLGISGQMIWTAVNSIISTPHFHIAESAIDSLCRRCGHRDKFRYVKFRGHSESAPVLLTSFSPETLIIGTKLFCDAFRTKQLEKTGHRYDFIDNPLRSRVDFATIRIRHIS